MRGTKAKALRKMALKIYPNKGQEFLREKAYKQLKKQYRQLNRLDRNLENFQ